MTQEEQQHSQWMSFRIGKETYALQVDNVREVTPYITPIPVPGSPDSIEGILNIRGNIVTVASGRKLLNLETEIDPNTSQVALLEMPEGPIGIIIDEVGGLISIPDETIERDLNHDNPELIIGTVRHEEKLVLLMSLNTYCEKLAAIKQHSET